MSFELGLKIMLALYVIVALAMTTLILLQRGQGAQAGSGFGGGASATVFGSRGSANFLSISTKWLAVLFFALSIGMGMYISHNSKQAPSVQDLGVMADADKADAAKPASGASDVPVAPATVTDVPTAAPAASDVPAATDANATAPALDVEQPAAAKPEELRQNETTPPASSN
jgi:preprotein translocase subunit SecG